MSRRTVQEWFAGGCPGRGTDGYDLAAIGAWRSAHRAPRRPLAEAGDREKWAARKESAIARTKELELARERGELIEVDYVARLLERHTAEHNTLLAQLRDRILGLLPAKTRPADRRRLLAGIDKATDDLRLLMAGAIEEWIHELDIRQPEDDA